ncbi:Molybdenum transport ATP-binding protein ModC [Devosia sp. H5989]|nr:Molybdenum transport ATP-binding protein ModC [Devosia sp. H5989]
MTSLSAAFTGELGAFRLDVAFDAPLDGVTALFGPSGSGKTTVLRAIAGLEHLKGRCALGRHVWQDALHFVPVHKRGIGYVFQEPSLFPHLSVRANLLYGNRRARGARAITFDAVVELLKIWKLLDRAPERLSGGERQRVSLGRALLSQPRLLLLDEPMSALDRGAKEEILPYFEALHTALGLPMILVSHDIAEVERLASHMLLMSNGKITASGPLNVLLTRPDLPFHQNRDAAAVLTARVVGQESDGLAALDIAGQRLLVAGEAGAPGDAVRVRIMARDVSLAVEPPSRTTILNILKADITAIEALRGPDAAVTLGLGDQTLLARITQRSVAALDLRVGQPVFAQVKGVALVTGPAQ